MLLSEHYFPNTDELDILNYVDTQVVNGISYEYEVSAHVITVAQRINSAQSFGEGDTLQVRTISQPELVMLKVPIIANQSLSHQDTPPQENLRGYKFPPVAIFTRPPVPPNISFLPYKDYKNEILIKAERMTDDLTGKRTIPYISLNEVDREIFRTLEFAQRKTNFDLPQGHVEFKSEGDADQVQVFRTTQEPQYDSDPAAVTVNLLREEAYSKFDRLSGGEGIYKVLTAETGFAFTDRIKTNTKYYYTFRSRDINNFVSNPTAIMQVEVVETEGISYPVIQEYIPTRSQPKTQKSRDLAKFIQIRPSYLGSEPLPDADGQIEAGNGANGDTPFDKHFKIRLTSKDTGRQIDLNCLFQRVNVIRQKE